MQRPSFLKKATEQTYADEAFAQYSFSKRRG